MSITVRQQRFIAEFAACGNAAEAARRAGYSKRSARQTGSLLLTKHDIFAALQELSKQNAAALDERRDSLVRDLMNATKQARDEKNATEMIRACRQMSRLLGFSR